MFTLPLEALSDNNEDPNKKIPFAIAISGGISLGSYESGLNWALINYIKLRRNEITATNTSQLYPELMSTVGASAGSINALISAIIWCADDIRHSSDRHNNGQILYKNTLDDNLFRTVWLNVGIDEILPADHTIYRQGDGVLTRAAFDLPIKQIKQILDSNIFRPDCSVPYGMTVTRIDPFKMSIANVEIENQRFMIPVRLQSSANPEQSGHINIETYLTNKDDPYLGNVIHLRERKHIDNELYTVEPEHLVNAVLASSAYPLAFSKVSLPNCSLQSANDSTAKPHECPPDFNPRIDDFVDGGVFDNVPLGIAKALAEPSETSVTTFHLWANTARAYNYIYLDPDIRRPIANSKNVQREEEDVQPLLEFTDHGIRSHLKFLQGAISTGRNYELYNVLRGGDWTRQVYSYACILQDSVNGETEPNTKCKPKTTPDFQTCQLLLKHQLDSGVTLTLNKRKSAAACIVQDATRLENIYYGFEGKNYTAAKITALRLSIIRRMQILAEQNGNRQLALTIKALKADKFGDRRLLLTTRFAPITGNMLGAFGAFLDKPFREYDYYAGVYDAILGLANFYCRYHDKYQQCLSQQTKSIYHKFDIASVDNANIVFYLLATHEHPEYLNTDSPWNWLNNINPSTQQKNQHNLEIIFYALAGNIDPSKSNIYKEPNFPDFIRALFDKGYNVEHSSEFMQRIYRLRKKDPSTWYYPITSRVSTRLLELEKDGDDEMSKFIRGTMGFGAFAVHSYVQDEESKLLIKSAAPADSWFTWLPYEIGADFRNGGLVVSWLPGLDLSEQFSLDLKITPVHLNRYGGEAIWFSQFDLFYSYHRKGLISSVGFGPTYSYTWEEWQDSKQNNLGASAYIAFLQDRLRLTVGQRTFDDTFAGEHIYLSISVMDIPGLAYWLSRGK